MIDNPFSYGKTVDGPFFYGRDTELDEIRLSMRNATNLIIYSPRRIGKSSLVLKALKDLENEGHPVVYIDFFKVSSREKLIELFPGDQGPADLLPGEAFIFGCTAWLWHL